MDFHEHQAQARAQSWRLVVLFVLAVMLVLVGVNAFGAFVWGLMAPGMGLPEHFVATNSGIVLLYVLGGSWLEWQRLSEGGSAVALRLGASALSEYNARHRRLLNVAEELAIAAGVPVPEVFVIEHDSINAMVAGHDQAHCALIVTRGALERLTRDELTGVLAHEYAHIVNGDMVLNTRLAGALYGLHSLSMLGHTMLRSVVHLRRRESASSIVPMPLMLFGGVVLSTVGSLGAVSARLVQAAVSRQREYLADAQAVQFVRGVDGLGRALRKIAGQHCTPMRSEYNEVVAHLWLSTAGMRRAWFDTHPPLATRVRRLHGRSLAPIRPELVALEPTAQTSAQAHPALPVFEFVGAAAVTALHGASVPTDLTPRHGIVKPGPAPHPEAVAPGAGSLAGARLAGDGSAGDNAARHNLADRGSTGSASTDHTGVAAERFPRTDAALMRAAFDAVDSARRGSDAGMHSAGVLIAAVRDPACNLSRTALLLNAIVAGPTAFPMDDAEQPAPNHDQAVQSALQWLEQREAQWLRVPLIEILTGRVRHWPLECRRTLVRYCHDAVLADGRVEKTEWIYFTLVRHRLLHDAHSARRHAGPIEKRRALAEVFSMAGHLSDQSARRVRDAVVNAATAIGVEQPTATPDGFEFRSLTEALDVLRSVPPLRKPVLLASLRELARDEHSPVYQAFLMAVSAAIDCPPPRTVATGATPVGQ